MKLVSRRVRHATRLSTAFFWLLAAAACTRVAHHENTGGRHNAYTKPHVLRIVDGQDFVTLNPHLYAATSLSMVSELTMAYLVRYDHRGRPYPELATEIPTQGNGGISRDGRTILWHLRRGVRWSDGAPFDAQDVAFSVRVVQNPANDEISRDGWELIDRVDVRGGDMVSFHLRKPYAAFLPTFFGTAGANPCILPRHLLDRLPNINQAPYNSLPVGIGPFRYLRWKRGEEVVLVANPLYFRGAPKLTRIEFHTIPSETTALTQMETGEADLWPLVRAGFYPRLRGLPGVVTQIIPGAYFSHLDFNLTRPLVQDRLVREALRLGTDRELIRQEVRHGTGSLQEGYAAPGFGGYDSSIPFHRYDPFIANRLLDRAGWRRGRDGVRSREGRRLRLEFAMVSGNPDTSTLAELIRRMWQQLGVELDVRSYPATLLFDSAAHGGILANGRFDVAEFAWQGDVLGDLSELYACDSVPPRGQNDLHYCNPYVDKLFREIKATYDPGRRKPIVAEVQRRIVADVATIVLAIDDDIYAQNSDLHAFHPNAVSPFDEMLEVDI